jgi:hypothetical protein
MNEQKEFEVWWDQDCDTTGNPYCNTSMMYWAWEAWKAGRKAERESCANVCDSYDVADDVCSSDTAEGIAIAIRARGQDD